MRDSVLSRLPRGLEGVGVPALLLIVLALATLHASQPLHLHHGATAGLYNEEHILAALDSASGDAPLPDPAPGIAIDISADRGPVAVADRLSGPVARSSAPRAPPVA